MRVWLAMTVAVAAGACSRPLVSQQDRGNGRYELRGDRERHFEIRLSFHGKELLHSDADLARCLVAPGNNPLAAICFDGPRSYQGNTYGRHAVFVRRTGSVDRHDITANAIGVFSTDGSAGRAS